MKQYDSISTDGICQEIDRKCGSSANTYPVKDKIARINAALDRYLTLAFQADGRWNFDDINETSPPIDTQSIVSGTNRYKLSAFSETLLSLIRLEILNSAGTGLPLIPETMDDLTGAIYNQTGRISGSVSDTFQERYVNASSGTPTHYIKYGDFIYLRPNPDYSETDGLLAYFNRPAVKSSPVAVTIANGADADFTATAHGLVADDTFLLLSDGTLPTGTTADTVYYVIATVTADTFNASANKGGTTLTTSSAGSGVHSFIKLSSTPGIPVIHHPYLAKHASAPYLSEKTKPQLNSVLAEIQTDERAIQEYFAYRDKDVRKQFIPNVENTH